MQTKSLALIWTLIIGGMLLCLGCQSTDSATASSAEVAASPAAEQFVNTWWYQTGAEYGNDHEHKRIWVNAPEVMLHPRFTEFSSLSQPGMGLILIDEDLTKLQAAQLLIEAWGGHQGTSHKRVTVNGRNTYYFKEVGTALMNHTHQYPLIDLPMTDLVNGQNAIQFTCDTGRSFWGLFIVEHMAIRAILIPNHPDIEEKSLTGFTASVTATPLPGREALLLQPEIPQAFADRIAKIDYHGYYEGYDENGNTKTLDWHGMIKNREPYGIIGTAVSPPFTLEFDTSMMLHDQPLQVKAVIHFKDDDVLTFETPAAEIPWPKRSAGKVSIIYADDLPAPFSSRLNRKSYCTLILDTPPDQIERAQLHLTQWDGGPRENEHPLTLNGHPIDVIGPGVHRTFYTISEIDPAILIQGENIIEVIADTEHHSIEIFLPGPGLVIKEK